MNDASRLRIAQLRRGHPELVIYDDKLLINAFCIDLVHGGAYAWAYLLRAGATCDHAQAILSPQPQCWDLEVDDISLTAERAMAVSGLHRHEEHTVRCRVIPGGTTAKG